MSLYRAQYDTVCRVVGGEIGVHIKCGAISVLINYTPCYITYQESRHPK